MNTLQIFKGHTYQFTGNSLVFYSGHPAIDTTEGDTLIPMATPLLVDSFAVRVLVFYDAQGVEVQNLHDTGCTVITCSDLPFSIAPGKEAIYGAINDFSISFNFVQDDGTTIVITLNLKFEDAPNGHNLEDFVPSCVFVHYEINTLGMK